MSWERSRPAPPFEALPEREEFTLVSDDVTDGAVLPMGQVYSGAGGDNLSPHLAWSGFPAGTKGFAVSVYDVDAPTLSGWYHWLVTDLPADCTELPTGAGDADGRGLPASARQWLNDYGTRDFGGAGPPPGDHDHRYYFTVYALDTDDLGLTEGVSSSVVSFTINAHTLARAHLMATFGH